MVGKKVKVTNPLIEAFFGVEEGTVTSYKAESYDAPNFPDKFERHEEGLTIVSDEGTNIWVMIEDVEVVE